MKILQHFKPTDRFLSILIYKFPLGNCGGITDNAKEIFIPCETGPYTFDKIDQSLVFIPEHRGGTYWAVQPMRQPIDMIGPMAGGNLAYSSDSRCKEVYHVHDRFETQQTYNSMSI